MTRARTKASSPEPRPSRRANCADELRRMVLLLETADVLEVRARRATDPAQIAVLLRRAEQRRRDAARLREELAAQGAALAAPAGRHASVLTRVLPGARRRAAPSI